MLGLMGRKIGMTQVYSERGEAVPVTLIEVGPCTVIQIKTPEKDGYAAVVIEMDEATVDGLRDGSGDGGFVRVEADRRER